MFVTLFGFARDRRGVAAMEFALILPMMVTLFFAAIELNELMSANKRVENVAASLADVVSRSTQVSNDDVDDLFTAGTLLMFPNSGTPLRVRVSRVDYTGNPDEGRVNWSDANNSGAGASLPEHADNTVLTLPDGVDQACGGSAVIVADTLYVYDSPIGYFLPAGFTLSHTAYVCPRVVDDIARVS